MKTAYRRFKIAENNTKVFKIKNNATYVLLSVCFSLISLFFLLLYFLVPFFGSMKKAMEAIHINLTGGIDSDKSVDESFYDEKTNYIWNNLLRKTTDRINKKEVEIIIEIQDEFIQLRKEIYSAENINYILINLGKVNIHRIRQDEIKDIFDAMQSYERNLDAKD